MFVIGCGRLDPDDGFSEMRADVDAMELEEAGTEDDDNAYRMSVSLERVIPVRVIFGALERNKEVTNRTCAFWDFSISVPEGTTLVLRRHKRFLAMPPLEKGDEVTKVGNKIQVKALTLGGRDGIKFFTSSEAAITFEGSVKSVLVDKREDCTQEKAQAGAEALTISELSIASLQRHYSQGIKNIEKNLGMLVRSGPIRTLPTKP